MAENFLGNIFGRAMASAIDSVLKDTGAVVKATEQKIKQARIVVREIKEKPDGEEESWFEKQEQETREKKKRKKT